MNQLTKEQAIAFGKEGAWENLSLDERALLQLTQDKLCMPFDKFHEAVTHLLGRSVWTHEFADPKALLAEYMGECEPRTMSDILELIPAEKRIVIEVPEKNDEKGA